MSTGKWEIVNGVRYPVEDLVWENPNDEDTGWKKADDTSFSYGGKVWDTVMEITAEEALSITRKAKKDWRKATDEELMAETFGEGIPGENVHSSSETIVVKMDEQKTQMPFGFAETTPLLELLWRKTGADCPGEEAELELPFGNYHIILQE